MVALLASFAAATDHTYLHKIRLRANEPSRQDMIENLCKMIEQYKVLVRFVPAELNFFGYLYCVVDAMRAGCSYVNGTRVSFPETCKTTIINYLDSLP